MAELRIGVLGAAKISDIALYIPAADIDGVRVTAIAARDRARAEAHAAEHAIATVHDTYEDLLADPAVDAVYNPLPISLHHQWTIAALRAGKPVLSEKPFASNTKEAEEMVAVANETGLALVEAFHWRYHPLADLIASRLPELGEITDIESTFTVPIPETDDVRHSWELSGGALMDLGCYAVQWARFVAGDELTVVGATMVQGRPNVDVDTDIQATTPSGATLRIRAAMHAEAPSGASLVVTGTAGTMHVENPIAPQRGHELRVELAGSEEPDIQTVTERSTYHFQLEAFRDAVVEGAPTPTGGDDAIATMRFIDAAYLAAGLPVRGSTL